MFLAPFRSSVALGLLHLIDTRERKTLIIHHLESYSPDPRVDAYQAFTHKQFETRLLFCFQRTTVLELYLSVVPLSWKGQLGS